MVDLRKAFVALISEADNSGLGQKVWTAAALVVLYERLLLMETFSVIA